MLLQLALGIIVTVKAFSVDSNDSLRELLDWTRYLMLANVGAVLAMLFGGVRAIPELARLRTGAKSMVAAVIGFAIAAFVLVWSYSVVARFVAIALDPDRWRELRAASESLQTVKIFTIVKDFGYALALILVVRTVECSARVNDQLELRYEAAHVRRALMVMLAGDLFYQVTYGLGGTIGILGAVGSLLVAGYWIWCHLRLARFLTGAAYFVNESHELPVATVVRVDKPLARSALPVVAPVVAAVVIAPPAPAPAARAPDPVEPPGDEPQFLR